MMKSGSRRTLWLLLGIGLIAAPACNLPQPPPTTLGMDARGPSAADKSDIARPAPMPRISPSTYLASGQMLEKQGNLVGAVEQYEKAVAANPRSGAGYNRLGQVLRRMGKLTDAEKILRHGIEAEPGSASLHNNLGYVQLLRQKYDLAERTLRDALALAPNFKRARMNLAICLAKRGRIADSVIEFSKVVPADVAYCNVAVVCLTHRDYENAEKALEQSLAINPDCEEAKLKLAEVRRLAHADRCPPSEEASRPVAAASEDKAEPPR